jgi:hypothetical protein
MRLFYVKRLDEQVLRRTPLTDILQAAKIF